MLMSLVIAHSQMFDHIGKDESHRARNSSHAVHENIGLFEGLVDEVDGSFEVDAEIIVLVIFSWDVQ
jgi:hypothetical protein